MRHVKGKRKYTCNQEMTIQELKEEKFYWPEFIKFKAFYVEQKWTKEERAIFVLYVVNPLSEDFIALKNIQSAFAELI